MSSKVLSDFTQKKRVFIAFPMNHLAQSAYDQIVSDLDAYTDSLRIIPYGNTHLTLQFLENLDDQEVQKIKLALNRVKEVVRVFETKWQKIGVFKASNSVWLGPVHSEPLLNKVYQSVYHELVAEGFQLSKRVFKPHITLARFKDRSGHLRASLRKIMGIGFIECKVPLIFDRIALFESQLGGPIPHYSILHEVKLKESNEH